VLALPSAPFTTPDGKDYKVIVGVFVNVPVILVVPLITAVVAATVAVPVFLVPMIEEIYPYVFTIGALTVLIPEILKLSLESLYTKLSYSILAFPDVTVAGFELEPTVVPASTNPP